MLWLQSHVTAMLVWGLKLGILTAALCCHISVPSYHINIACLLQMSTGRQSWCRTPDLCPFEQNPFDCLMPSSTSASCQLLMMVRHDLQALVSVLLHVC